MAVILLSTGSPDLNGTSLGVTRRPPPGIGRSILLFDRVDRERLAALGDVRTPSIPDLLVADMGNQAGQARGAAR